MSKLGTDASSAGPAVRVQVPVAGEVALSSLAAPLNVNILRTLNGEPKSLLDLRKATGSPPQGTMRLYLQILSEQGIVHRRKRPGAGDYELTQAGRDLIAVGDVLESWLSGAPSGPVARDSTAWKSTTKALVEGWSSNIVRAIAARSLSLAELNKMIPKVSRFSLERRLESMRLVGLVRPQSSKPRGVPYGATDWLRRSIVPMASAAAWERRYRPPGTGWIGRLGVEAVFLLAIPLLEVPPNFSGKFRLAVELRAGDSPVFAGVLVCFRRGTVISCSSRLEGEADGWISGTPEAWLKRMSGIESEGLEIKGDVGLAGELLDALKNLGTLPTPRGSGPA